MGKQKKNQQSGANTTKLHGNSAKIDPTKHVDGLYATNLATAPKDNGKHLPEADVVNIESARECVNENQK